MENENMDEWFAEEWTMDGFQEAGEVLEEVLEEVMAFVEMSGTVQTKNYHHTSLELGHNQSWQEPEIVPPIQPQLPDRMNELMILENEIMKIETENS